MLDILSNQSASILSARGTECRSQIVPYSEERYQYMGMIERVKNVYSVPQVLESQTSPLAFVGKLLRSQKTFLTEDLIEIE